MKTNSQVGRLIDRKLVWYLSGLPAISIEGAKGVGKTTLAEKYATTTFKLDDEAVAELITGTPRLIQDANKPVLLDEWQRRPSIWDSVRRFVDDDMAPGQYLLTGSSYPRKVKLHSGAGRIVRLRMRPFSLVERKLAPSLFSISDIIASAAAISSEKIDIAQQDYVKEIFRSGFPGIRKTADEFQGEALKGYIDNIVERDFEEQGVELRRPEALRAWLKAYAAAEATTTSYEAIMGAATPGQEKKPSKPTTMIYRDTLSALWILDPVLPWIPEGNVLKNLGKAPKHYLADPALSACLLDITEQRLLQGEKVRVLGDQTKTIIGRLFESLVSQSLKVYCDVLGLELRHLRTNRGDHEIDFIIEKGDVVLAVEAKFSPTVSHDDVKHLNWLDATMPDRRVVKIVAYTGQYLVQRDSDDVILVPAACLGV